MLEIMQITEGKFYNGFSILALLVESSVDMGNLKDTTIKCAKEGASVAFVYLSTINYSRSRSNGLQSKWIGKTQLIFEAFKGKIQRNSIENSNGNSVAVD
jgi:hypothetical protein